MTATAFLSRLSLMSRLVNGILAVKPLASFAKHRARNMMIQRAERLGVPWRENVRRLQARDWESEKASVENPRLTYPDYYLRSFHAYETGNLNWEAAWEQESAAYTVHSTIWPGAGVNGDPRLRQAYHEILHQHLATPPQTVLDVGCGVGLSTFALHAIYPQASMTGLDLSPHFLSVAQYNSRERHVNLKWRHAAAESSELPDASFDLISAFLVFHELPQSAATEILTEARRLLRPGGHLAIMDMNPRSEIYQKMPPYILTLLKSTEPYLDQYFTLDMAGAIARSGFAPPTITPISPRHRAVIAAVS